MPSIGYTSLCEEPSAVIFRLTCGQGADLLYYGRTIAHVRRPLHRAEVPEGIAEITIGGMARNRDDRAVLLMDGGSFAIVRHGRRIAVVEGIKS